MQMRNIFKPRYKRMVNKIFPENPYEGLRIDQLKRLIIYATLQQKNWNQVLLYLTIKLKKYTVIGEEV